MLASGSDGLLGLDRSFAFSAAPLEHVFIVIHGLGDQYIESPPWLTCLENSLRQLQRLVSKLNDSTQSSSAPAPPILLVPLEYHEFAQRHLFQILRPHVPPDARTPVRTGLDETVGDALLASSPYFRGLVAAELKRMLVEQVAALRRARPSFHSGSVSLLAHSTGAVFATEMLQRGLLDDVRCLDAVVLLGAPLPAYYALDPAHGTSVRDAMLRRSRDGLRFFNVYHPLDPVAYRLEPWLARVGDPLAPVGASEQPGACAPPVLVGAVDQQNLWDGAASFFDDTVQSVISTIFPKWKEGVDGRRDAHPRHTEGAASRRQGSGPSVVASPTLGSRQIPRQSRYLVKSANGSDKEMVVGSEMLLRGRVDFQLQEGLGPKTLEVVSNWAAVKAHGFYWRSVEVAQILVDVAGTSKVSTRGL